jgi:ribonuclease-3
MLDDAAKSVLEVSLGYRFRDPALLERAMTHSSMTDSGLDANERLEFLGDAVLGMVVCELLFQQFPNYREGELTKIKSHTVSRETCAVLARRLGLDQHLLVGKGMMGTRELPASLAACALEGVIGAIYLDGGMDAARAFIAPLVQSEIDQAAASGHHRNFKSVLQQHCQSEFGTAPVYRILDEQGPDHAKCFKIGVEVAGRRFSACWGATKKKAEQEAAMMALRELGVVEASDGGDVRLVK